MSRHRPPILAVALMWPALLPKHRDLILGDLAEQFDTKVEKTGRLRAIAWYWRQVLQCSRTRLHERFSRRKASATGRIGARAPVSTPGGQGQGPGNRIRLIERIGQDTRFAVRALLKEPGWTAATVCTLALAIGATTAIFSIVNTVLLRPLDYRDPERLAVFAMRPMNEDAREFWTLVSDDAGLRTGVTHQIYEAFRDMTQDVFEDTGVYGGYRMIWSYTVNLGEGAERFQGAFVSAGLLRTLGAAPELGRVFRDEEDVLGSPGAVLLSHGLWQRRFGGSRDVLGTTIPINDAPHTIVGVMPPSFGFPSEDTELWVPSTRGGRSTGGWNFEAVGRLREGITVSQAEAIVRDRSVEITQREAILEIGLTPLPLQTHLVGEVRPLLLVFVGAVAALLLVGCLNVANLLLARATRREKEHVVRAALGAGRLRLAQQLVTESIVVSALGGALGLVLARFLTSGFVALSPVTLPRQGQIGIDAGVLGFTLALTIAVGLVIGLVPALGASNANLGRSLNATTAGSGASVRHGRIRDGLVVAQLGMALTLLVCAGLLLRSFLGLLSVETGFDPRNTLTFDTSMPESRYETFEQHQRFYDELLGRIKALPGVRSAAVAVYLPVSGWFHTVDFVVEGYDHGAAGEAEGELKQVSSGYFATLGIPLLEGRVFDERDGAAGPDVVIINESMARHFWPGTSALGARLQLGEESLEVVGVVADVQYRGDLRDVPQMYRTYAGGSYAWRMSVAARTETPPHDLMEPARRIVSEIDPEVAVFNMSALDDHLWNTMSEPRFRLLLLGSFGIAALALSVIGVYGVMAYAVVQRTRELGIRKALGANRRDVMRQVVRRGMVLTSIGLALGALGAYLATGALEAYLFNLGTHDPLTFAGAVVALTGASLLACVLPARRAAAVDPLVALRADQ